MPNDLNKSPKINKDESPPDVQKESQPTDITKVPTKKSPLIPFLVSTIVVLIGVGGFFAYKYFSPEKNLSSNIQVQEELPPSISTPNPSPTAKPSPAPTIDPYSDWLSHTDDTMGLTFKYPPIWDYHYLNQNPPSIMVAPKDIVDKIKNAPGGFGGGTFLTMIISLHDYDPTPQTDEFTSVVSTNATIDSTPVTHYVSTYLQEGPGFEAGQVVEDYLLPLGNQYLKIGLYDLDQKVILDQIVSKITFTN